MKLQVRRHIAFPLLLRRAEEERARKLARRKALRAKLDELAGRDAIVVIGLLLIMVVIAWWPR